MTRTAMLILILGLVACDRPAPSLRATVGTAAAGKQSVASPAVPPTDASPANDTGHGLPRPAVAPVDTTARLELPSSMREVLDDSIPGFVAWSMEHYAPEVQWWVAHIRQNVPWAVFGDFNSDSIPDLVMDGTDGRRSLRVALVSTGPTYRLLVLKVSPVYDQLKSIEFLAYQAPGMIDTLACNEGEDQCHAVPSNLAADAFQVVHYEKASSVWYWTGDGFAQSSTSD